MTDGNRGAAGVARPETIDRRPIILFRSLPRAMAKVISWQAKTWVRNQPCEAIVSSPTRQASDVIYRSQICCLTGFCQHSMEMLLEAKRCFDNVDRKQLHDLAVSAGPPRTL